MACTIGIDIGKSLDNTVCVVLETWRPEPSKPKERPELQHAVHRVEKVSLGLDYREIVARIVQTVEWAAPLGRCMLVVDASGVGAAVVDFLRSATTAQMRTVVFTGGDAESKDGSQGFRVPKRDILAPLRMVIDDGRITVAPDCPFQEDLRDQLKNMEYKIAERSGHDTYAAAGGGHDDCVMALALATWWASRTTGAAFDAWMQVSKERLERTPQEWNDAMARARARAGPNTRALNGW